MGGLELLLLLRPMVRLQQMPWTLNWAHELVLELRLVNAAAPAALAVSEPALGKQQLLMAAVRRSYRKGLRPARFASFRFYPAHVLMWLWRLHHRRALRQLRLLLLAEALQI